MTTTTMTDPTTVTVELTGQEWLASSVEVGDLVRHPSTGCLVRVTEVIPFDSIVMTGLFGVDVLSGEETAFTPKVMERVWVADR